MLIGKHLNPNGKWIFLLIAVAFIAIPILLAWRLKKMKGDNPQDLAQRRKQLKAIDKWLFEYLKKPNTHPFHIVGSNNGTDKRQRRESVETLFNGI
jgi:hypothetical protein